MHRKQATDGTVALDPVGYGMGGSVSAGLSGRRRAFIAVVIGLVGLMSAACDTSGSASAEATARSIAKETMKGELGPGHDVADQASPAEPAHADATAATVPPDLPVGIDPVRLEIPSIGVDAPVVDLDLRGPEPEVPSDFADSGWYQQTRRPGEIGPSVIAGHVDSVSGPAVFARLGELRPGDRIIVHGEDDQTRTFVVNTTGQYPKQDLPPAVFAFDAPLPELRLITCGGIFERTSGHYRDNLVVYAQIA